MPPASLKGTAYEMSSLHLDRRLPLATTPLHCRHPRPWPCVCDKYPHSPGFIKIWSVLRAF